MVVVPVEVGVLVAVVGVAVLTVVALGGTTRAGEISGVKVLPASAAGDACCAGELVPLANECTGTSGRGGDGNTMCPPGGEVVVVGDG